MHLNITLLQYQIIIWVLFIALNIAAIVCMFKHRHYTIALTWALATEIMFLIHISVQGLYLSDFWTRSISSSNGLFLILVAVLQTFVHFVYAAANTKESEISVLVTDLIFLDIFFVVINGGL